jgi:hypothetical protein
MLPRLSGDKTDVEEAHLNGARVRLATARDSLATYSVAKLGSAPRTVAMLATPKAEDDEAAEK